ncbi:MAG TPA: Gfo/Idh/MocA family oxidoreductase [Rhodothermales bacterium]|nr:Gfo/Idh/MocA family oxidoreductase [Rhodothermales bacterium]
MNIGIIGTGTHATVRRQAAGEVPGVQHVEVLAGVSEIGIADASRLDAFLDGVEVVFVTVPTAAHFRIAEAATKQGVHVFLEWPPATSIRECQDVVQLSEEAGVEVGVSRPLRFHPVFETLPEAWRAALILLRQEIDETEEAAWPRWLADAIDLCCTLAQSHSVQRVDAEAVRMSALWPEAVACGLRFHSGSYAQISIRRSQAGAAHALYAANGDFDVAADLLAANDGSADAYVSSLVAETQAFLHAIIQQQPVPVSILDGLHTMRLVERLMEKLR